MAVPCVSRRRSSFIVLSGLEGTYAVPLTGPGYLQQLRDATRPLAEMLALHGMRHERHFRVQAVLFYCCYTTPGQDSCSRKGRSGREARVGPAAATKRKGHLESST